MFNQGNAACDREKENLLDDDGATLDAVVDLICFDSLRSDYGGDVLYKIDAALFARAAFALLVFARRALITQRGVTTRAETRDLTSVCSAFRAFDHALRGHGCVQGHFDAGALDRADSRLCRRVARLTGRGASAHAYILAGDLCRLLCAEWECGLRVNTGRWYR